MSHADGSGAASRGQVRRRAILEAAHAVFVEKGFERASLAEILSRSGGSRATLYEQFGGKEGLFEAVIAESCAAMLAAFDTTRREDGQTPRQLLIRLGMHFLEHILAPGPQTLWRVVMAEGMHFPRVAEMFYRTGPQAVRTHLARHLSRLAADGVLDLPDAEAAAGIFIGMAASDAHCRFATSAAFPAERLQEQICLAVDIFLRGVERR
jgi:AcrR family transcriptional regulator